MTDRPQRTATVTQSTNALAHTGRGFTLNPGSYPVVDIDGADGVLYITGPDDKLCCIDPHDPNITIGRPEETP